MSAQFLKNHLGTKHTSQERNIMMDVFNSFMNILTDHDIYTILY